MSKDDSLNTFTAAEISTFQLSTGPVASAFAEKEVAAAFRGLMDKAHAMELTAGQFIDALVNVHAEYLASLLGPRAAGELLQDIGRHLSDRAKQN
ncbi:hypothetical protein [Caenispirillum bisanense]|uniref:Uncharacterized protein n=1 Tax=Caenispirillum bisanense TaxID=414052 RepID=A0A286GTB1_9PROT|nr:hypothetical protein [Caenispirillum bisanense]SOD98750.1 hypothetical protein SAMN05421508_10872 [Caenispirillum bisanense]